MSSNTEKWYLKIAENQVFGPASLDTLRTWAADGRIAPDHTISDTRKHWSPASTLSDLELEWEVHLDNGERFGPIHIQAIRDLLFSEQASWSTPLLHIPSKRECTVQDEAASIFGASEAIKKTQAAKAELTKRDRQISKLKKQHSELKTTLTDLHRSQENNHNKLQTLNNKLTTLQNEKKTIETEKISLLDEITRLQKTVSDLQQTGTKNQQALYQNLETREKQLADCTTQIETLLKQADASQNEISDLTLKIVELNRERDLLTSARDDLQTDRNKLAETTKSLTRERDQIHSKVDQLTDETEALNKTISDLNGKNNEQQATINTQAADIKSGEQALAAQTAATEDQRKALEQKMISGQQDYQNLKNSTQTAIEKLQITITDLTTQLNSTRGALAKSAEALKTEQQQRMDVCEQSERLQHDLQIIRDEATTLEAELRRQLSLTEQQYRETVEAHNALNSELQTVRTETQSELQALQSVRGELEAEVERQRTVIHERKQREQTLQQDLSQHTKHMESEMATWEQREEMLHHKIDQLQERCEIALSESRELHAQLEITREALEEAQKTPTANPLQHLERQAQEELKRWMKKR